MSTDLVPTILRVQTFPDIFVNALKVHVLLLGSLEVKLVVKVILRFDELVLSVPDQQFSQLSLCVDLARIVAQDDA